MNCEESDDPQYDPTFAPATLSVEWEKAINASSSEVVTNRGLLSVNGSSSRQLLLQDINFKEHHMPL
jgi:hypothetical protein